MKRTVLTGATLSLACIAMVTTACSTTRSRIESRMDRMREGGNAQDVATLSDVTATNDISHIGFGRVALPEMPNASGIETAPDPAYSNQAAYGEEGVERRTTYHRHMHRMNRADEQARANEEARERESASNMTTENTREENANAASNANANAAAAAGTAATAETARSSEIASERTAVAERNYHVVEFTKGSSDLTDSQKDEIRSWINAEARKGDIRKIDVAAWSDQALPQGKTKLSKNEQKLAKDRLKSIKSFVKAETKHMSLTEFNMAEHANWLARVFHTKDAELKSLFARRGAPVRMSEEDFADFRKAGGPMKAVMFAEMKSSTSGQVPPEGLDERMEGRKSPAGATMPNQEY